MPLPTLSAGHKVLASEWQAILDFFTPLYSTSVSDQSVTSSTTLVNATGLSLSLPASTTWRISGHLLVAAGTVPDIKIGQTIPSGATGYWTILGQDTPATTTFGSLFVGINTDFSLASSLGGVGIGTTMLYRYDARLTTTNAGTFQIQFAQATSDGTAATMKAQSNLAAWRVA